jgi:hypothetical protein
MIYRLQGHFVELPEARKARSRQKPKPAASPTASGRKPRRRTSTPAIPETSHPELLRARHRGRAGPCIDTAVLVYRAVGATDTRSRQIEIGMLNVVCFRTSIKIVVYDGQGFWLCQKRLSNSRFSWWPDGTQPACTLQACELQVLLMAGDPTRARAAPAWRALSVAA